MQNFAELSRKELQQIAKENGIKANGKSADIIKLLEAHFAAVTTSAEEPVAEVPAAEKEPSRKMGKKMTKSKDEEELKKSESVETLVIVPEKPDSAKKTADPSADNLFKPASSRSTPTRKSVGQKKREQEDVEAEENANPVVTQSLDRGYAVKKMRKEEDTAVFKSAIPKTRFHGKMRPAMARGPANSQPCPLPSKDAPETEFTFQGPKVTKFNLMESLQKPLPYKPHTGPLKPFVTKF